MKNRSYLLLAISLFLLMSFSFAHPAFSAGLKTATVTTPVLNVRTGPATTYERIGTVTENSVLPVLSEKNGWVQISLQTGKSGWVSGDYVTLKTQQPTQWARVTTDVLNVRTGPSTTYSKIGTVTLGTSLPVQQRVNGWLLVQLQDGTNAWISGEYAVLRNDAADRSGQAPLPKPEPEKQKTGIVNVFALNVRSGPSINSSKVTLINQGTKLTVLQQAGDWLQVRLPDTRIGWVAAEYVTIGQTPTVPQPEKTPDKVTVTAETVLVQVAPNTGQVVAVLPKGTVADILDKQEDWYQIALADGKTGWVSTSEVAVDSSSSTPEEGGSGENPGYLSGKVIVIDPGHGGTSSGAVGVTGLVERDVNLDVAQRTAARLRAAGATVIMTRDSNYDIYLADRVNTAEAAGADIFVSIHANAHPDRRIGGTETYYYRYKAASQSSSRLAAQIQDELVAGNGLRNIGVKHGNFHVIRETTMPAVLVELAFLSNAAEEALMRTSAFRENSATAIFNGIVRYFQ